MIMKKTEKGTKKFSKAEKLAILKEASKEGVKATLAKYDLYPSTYYYWKKKLFLYGEEGLKHQKVLDYDQEIKRLRQENEALKTLLAKKKLEGQLKDDALRKMYPEMKKKI